MWVGVDDTDSPQGGCTTHFALELAAAFGREHALVLRRLPRLVRLNPNVPWKTRGNAAVCLELGRPRGGGTGVGLSLGKDPVTVHPEADPVAPTDDHLETVAALVHAACDLEKAGTDPAAVLVSRPLPAHLYKEAVTGVVDPVDTLAALAAADGARFFALGDGRGVVGAAAAVAWPARESTFELIAYRERERWGTKRRVGYATVEAMDAAYSETFNNVDRLQKHAAVAPATPCPVLIGVRARRPDRLVEAARSVEAGEPWGGFLLFETNQGTDDHVVDRLVSAARPLETVRAEGTVASRPRRVEGGHVFFPLADEEGALDCAAYEPTKAFRDLVEGLEAGDRVRVVGAVRADGRAVNIEKIEVISTVPRAGGARDVRGMRVEPPAPGWYEVPVAARRHLARPLEPHG